MNLFARFCVIGLSVAILAACTSTAVMPTSIADGQASYVYNNDYWVTKYTGEWVANTPKGRGQADVSSDGKLYRACSGEFGTAAPTTLYGEVDHWGRYDGFFDRSTLLNGVYTVTYKNKKSDCLCTTARGSKA